MTVSGSGSELPGPLAGLRVLCGPQPSDRAQPLTPLQRPRSNMRTVNWSS